MCRLYNRQSCAQPTLPRPLFDTGSHATIDGKRSPCLRCELAHRRRQALSKRIAKNQNARAGTDRDRRRYGRQRQSRLLRRNDCYKPNSGNEDDASVEPKPLVGVQGPVLVPYLDKTMLCTLLAVSGIEKTSAEFRAELCRVAARLGTDPNYLAAVMSVESGFNASIRNPLSGATGLIQFIPATAKRLGTSTAELAKMTAVEQLVYVEKYFQPFAGRLNTVDDVYLVVFCPAGVGKGPDFVLAREDDSSPGPCGKQSLVYAQNSGLDTNKDGVITNDDAGSVVRAVLTKAQSKPPILVDVDMTAPPLPGPKTSPVILLMAFAGGGSAGWYLGKWVHGRFTRG